MNAFNVAFLTVTALTVVAALTLVAMKVVTLTVVAALTVVVALTVIHAIIHHISHAIVYNVIPSTTYTLIYTDIRLIDNHICVRFVLIAHSRNFLLDNSLTPLTAISRLVFVLTLCKRHLFVQVQVNLYRLVVDIFVGYLGLFDPLLCMLV
jgi:hypothetical protein